MQSVKKKLKVPFMIRYIIQSYFKLTHLGGGGGGGGYFLVFQYF